MQQYYKAPLQQSNITNITIFLNEADTYIANLKEGNNILVCNSRRWTGFVGFRVCINSVLNLYKELIEIEKPVLKYLPTYKLSQDNIEIFFGFIRSKFGCNNNPTARQFIAAFKKIIIHKKIHCPQGANCIALEEMDILVRSSSKSPIDGINSSTSPLESVFEEERKQINDEHNYILQFTPNNLSLFTKEVVGYIAGFVVKKLEQKIKCAVCIHALRADERMQSSLFSIKNREGLIFPSKDVINVCSLVEAKIRQCLCATGLKNFNKKMIGNVGSSVLSSFLEKDIFKTLYIHCYNQSFDNNHMLYLIRAICDIYVDIRLHHSTKLFTEQLHKTNIRQHNLKTTLFLGQ